MKEDAAFHPLLQISVSKSHSSRGFAALEQRHSSVSPQPCLVTRALWPRCTSASAPGKKQKTKAPHFAQMFTQSKQSWSGAISGLLAIYRLFSKRVLCGRAGMKRMEIGTWSTASINQLFRHYNQMRCTWRKQYLTSYSRFVCSRHDLNYYRQSVSG